MLPDRLAWLFWTSFTAIALIEAFLGRKARQQGAPIVGRQTGALMAMVIAGVLVLAVRAVAAITRSGRSVDEAAAAAFAEFLRSTGEGLFSRPWVFRGFVGVYLIGSLDDPFTRVEIVTSAVVALTGVLIGLTALSLGCRWWGGAAAVVAYALGILCFEGLSSNKEPYANLFIAAYLLVRLRPGDMTLNRAFLSGLCLGGAVVAKEQTVVLGLVEPIVVIWQFIRGEGPRLSRGLAHITLMAMGAAILPSLILCGFALHGQLGGLITVIRDWAVSAGSPFGSLRAFDPTGGRVAPITWFRAYLPLWRTPVTLAGVAELIALTVDPRRGKGAGLPLVAIGALSLAMISIGQRWFGHYYMLAVPILTLLFVLWVSELPSALGAPGRRVFALALGVFMLWGLTAAVRDMRHPELRRSRMDGIFVWPAQQRPFQHAAAFLRERIPGGQRIMVWGWQPQLYIAARRSPVTRMVDPSLGTARDVLEDLNRYGPPAAVVLPGPQHFGVPTQAEVVYALSRHPEIARWLTEHHYVPALLPAQAGRYVILLRPDLASAEEIKAAGPRSLPIGLRGVTKGLVLSLLRGDAACRWHG